MTFKFKLNSVENCLRRALLLVADIMNDVKNNENKITDKTYTNINRFLTSEYMYKFEEESSTDQTMLGKLTTDKRCLYKIVIIFNEILDESDIFCPIIKTINNLNRVFNSKQIKDFINNRFTRSN
jgi:hypothetical protein